MILCIGPHGEIWIDDVMLLARYTYTRGRGYKGGILGF